MTLLPNPIELIIAGVAGQGAVLSGTLAATAAVSAGKFATQTSRTGAAVRHGSSESHVIISETPIDFPYVEHPHFLLALHQFAVDRHGAAVPPTGSILYDPATTSVPETVLCQTVPIPASREAERNGMTSGNENFILLGALAALYEPFSLPALLHSLEQVDRLPLGTEACLALGATIGSESRGL